MSPLRTLRAGVLASVCLFAATRADAVLVVEYDFNGALGNQVSQAATSGLSGIDAAAITRGSGITAAAGLNSINSSGWSTGGLDANDYYQFDIATSGFSLDLTSLEFTERRSLTGIRTIEIRSSLDGFTSAISTIGVPDDDANRREVVALGSAFDNVAAVTFRIYGYAAEAAVGTWRLGVDAGSAGGTTLPRNLQLFGNVVPAAVVPEPGTMVLALTALVPTIFVARRRRRLAA